MIYEPALDTDEQENVITFAVTEKKTNQRGRNDNGTRKSTTVNKDNRIGEYLFIDDQPKTVEIHFLQTTIKSST